MNFQSMKVRLPNVRWITTNKLLMTMNEAVCRFWGVGSEFLLYGVKLEGNPPLLANYRNGFWYGLAKMPYLELGRELEWPTKVVIDPGNSQRAWIIIHRIIPKDDLYVASDAYLASNSDPAAARRVIGHAVDQLDLPENPEVLDKIVDLYTIWVMSRAYWLQKAEK